MDKRPTIRDIASKAKCHYSTVSLALRNNPKIPQKTRDLIQGIAEDLRYRPDPMLSALTAYRRDSQPHHSNSALAWVTNHSTKDGWRRWYISNEFYQGAKKEAETCGYRLDEFWLQEDGMTSRRLNQILKTRNIQGLLFPPQQFSTELNLNWDQFSAVTFGYSLLKPEFHRETTDEYRNMRHLMKELYCRGYKRPGYVGLNHAAERYEFKCLAAFMLEQLEIPESNRIPPLVLDEWDDAKFIQWYTNARPDVIATRYIEMPEVMDRFGIKALEDVGLGYYAIHSPDLHVSGIRKNAFRIGIAAADLVINMIQRNERGVPRFPQTHYMEGYWQEGETLRARDEKKVAAHLNPGNEWKLNFASDSFSQNWLLS